MFSNSFNCFLTAKPTISVGQALLILMDTYKKDKEFLEELKVLYLVGANTDENLTRINQLLKDKALCQYSISREKSCISEDPTRRYFESMLAWGTVYDAVESINAESLENMFQTIFSLLSEESKHSAQYIFSNGAFKDMAHSFEEEVQIALQYINCGEAFEQFLPEERSALAMIVRLVYTSICLVGELPLPIDIYGQGYFTSTHRGRIEKLFEDQANVRSHHLGLLKSYMPLPADDFLYCEKTPQYLRVADRYHFDPEALWVSHHFASLVHPYSASISGTMLAFMRTLNYLHHSEFNEFIDIESFSSLIKVTTSLFLFNAGGHSLNEFISLLQLSEVQEAFKYIDGFDSQLTLEKLFLQDNDEAFGLALEQTISYNNELLNKAKIHAQLKERHQLNKANKYGVVNSEENSDDLTQSCSSPTSNTSTSTSTSTSASASTSTRSIGTAKVYTFLNDESFTDKNSEESSDDNTQSCSASSTRRG